MVSPSVILTAAHCTDGTLGKVAVTFRSVIAEQPPSGLPVAADPAAGYTQTQLEGAGYYSGTAHTHPQYSDFTDMANWNDIGVVVLDQPVTDDPSNPFGIDLLAMKPQPVDIRVVALRRAERLVALPPDHVARLVGGDHRVAESVGVNMGDRLDCRRVGRAEEGTQQDEKAAGAAEGQAAGCHGSFPREMNTLFLDRRQVA